MALQETIPSVAPGGGFWTASDLAIPPSAFVGRPLPQLIGATIEDGVTISGQPVWSVSGESAVQSIGEPVASLLPLPGSQWHFYIHKETNRLVRISISSNLGVPEDPAGMDHVSQSISVEFHDYGERFTIDIPAGF